MVNTPGYGQCEYTITRNYKYTTFHLLRRASSLTYLYSVLGFLTDSEVIVLEAMIIVPHPIEGSVGGRIRVVFGDNRNKWLLLINHDNGDST